MGRQSRHCSKKRVEFDIFTRMSPIKSGGSSKFPGELKIRHGVAQRIFVRDVNLNPPPPP